MIDTTHRRCIDHLYWSCFIGSLTYFVIQDYLKPFQGKVLCVITRGWQKPPAPGYNI